jgi:hypothetical protein
MNSPDRGGNILVSRFKVMSCRALAAWAVAAALLVSVGAALGAGAKQPTTAPSTRPDRIGHLIRQLGDDAFEVRESAAAELSKLGEGIRQRLQEAAGPANDPEIRARARQLLGMLDPEVEVIGVYEGTCPPDKQRQPGVQAIGAVTVRLGNVKKARILVLTSYEPVVWTVEDPAGRVVRVIASGYHNQTVQGLDKSIPVTLSSVVSGNVKDWFYGHKKLEECNDPNDRHNYERLMRRVKELTRQEPKEFQGAYRGSTFEIRD